MAKLSFTFPAEMEEQFRKAENIHEIAKKMVEAGAPVLIEAIRKRLEPHRDTGALIESVSVVKMEITQSGAAAEIGFDGTDSKGTANDIKANVLEYGTSKRKAHPFLTKSRNDAEPGVIAAMQEILDREVSGA